MARKKWVQQTDITPSLIRFRERKKWQISFRRYVLEKNKCVQYAPYFGLDIETMRKWFETQFDEGISWDDFGTKWQFDHIVPVIYFDFSSERELKLCWNFTNIRVEFLTIEANSRPRPSLLVAKTYFDALYRKTQYKICMELVEKINKLELSQSAGADKQISFITTHKSVLDTTEHYSSFEFELLNSGRSISQVNEEVNFLKKF